MYKILQEKIAVEAKSQHSMITAIFATDPSNPWSWNVIFDSTATKQIYETRDTSFAKDFEGVTYTFRLRTKGAAKQLLVAVQSTPLFPSGELALYLRRLGMVKKVVGQSYAFSHWIDSGLRRIALLLNMDVEAPDIPGFMTRSHDIRRKLLFQRKIFYCGRCHSKHTFHEDCPSEQEDKGQQPPTKQNRNREQQDLPEATPEIHQNPETPSERNKVEQKNAALGQSTAH